MIRIERLQTEKRYNWIVDRNTEKNLPGNYEEREDIKVHDKWIQGGEYQPDRTIVEYERKMEVGKPQIVIHTSSPMNNKDYYYYFEPANDEIDGVWELTKRKKSYRNETSIETRNPTLTDRVRNWVLKNIDAVEEISVK